MLDLNKRISWVDIGKYICIIFILMIHLDSNTKVLEALYSPFCLNLFLFLAGYVYKHPSSFEIHIKKKIKGLFIPWLVLSNLNILMSVIFSFTRNRDYKTEFIMNLIQIREKGDGIWFVAALFVAFIPFYLINKIQDSKKRLFVFVGIAILCEAYILFFPQDVFPWGNNYLPWHIEYIGHAMFWMAMGYYFKNEWEKEFDQHNNVRFRIISGLVYLLTIYFSYYSGTWITNLLFNYASRFAGVIFIISLCKVMKTNRYISYVGANTLVYFAFHGKVYTVIQKVLESKCAYYYNLCLSDILLSSVIAIMMALLMSIILIIPAYIINRWFPWMIGRAK
ncbi:MAG: acyltransferase [Butyrivibrio sp.]|nr:acyltransferase [Butyrivibrio sp.]